MAGLLVTRYFWLMMGFFAVFQGLIYNEFFAVPNNWFGTCYDIATYKPEENELDIKYYEYPEHKDCVYTFGMDPAFALSGNYLTFTNNIKEKLAVIIAYFHLNFGIVLNALNCIYFGNYKKLTFDIITGFFIFLGLIGYMIVLIYVKWWFPVYTYDTVDPATFKTELTLSTAPSIINLLIGDVMGPTGFADKNDALFYFFDKQQDISNILVLITFICLPIMLCAIPCIAICCGPKHEDHEDEDGVAGVAAHNKDEDREKLMGNGADGLENNIMEIEQMLKLHCPKEDSHGGIGEVFIHQVIETIEFVLGCISNTASYLRLWALSLAHGQLGEVFIQIFFTQLPEQGLTKPADMSSAVATFYFFFMGFGYMFAVMCVLLMMDVLEVFLHTMRLHWVEFMGKFYEGAGLPYRPFSFKAVFNIEKGRKDTN